MLQAKRIRIIGVPIDLGARLRGANMAPSALRVAEIGPKLRELGHEVEDAGNIHVAVREAVKKPDPRSKTKYLREIVSAAVELKREVYQSARDGRIPLVLALPRNHWVFWLAHPVQIRSCGARRRHAKGHDMPSLIIDHRFPRRDFTSITQLGIKVLNLALAHQAVIEPRLPKGMLATLQSDLEGLAPARADTLLARSDAKQATTDHMAALAQTCLRLRALRKVLRVARAPIEVQRAYGVGTKVRKNSPTQVEAALKQILDREKAHPDELSGYGILAEDVDALKAALSEVTSADFKQEQQRARAPDSTKARNRMANRIMRTALRIGAAGMLAFVGTPEVWSEFAAIQVGVNASKKGEKRAGGEVAKAKTKPRG